MTRLKQACTRLGIAHPNQFAWYLGLESYGVRKLMLAELGLRDRRWQIVRKHDPRDSSVKPVFRVVYCHDRVFESRSLVEALDFISDRREASDGAKARIVVNTVLGPWSISDQESRQNAASALRASGWANDDWPQRIEAAARWLESSDS